MRVVFGGPEETRMIAAWVAARIPQMDGVADFGPCVAFGVEDEQGRPVGGVVFHNHQPRFRNIEGSFASDTPRWLTRDVICKILSYPFDQLDCIRLTALTPRQAASARRFLDTFGFKREGIVRRGFGTDDMVVSGLMRHEWATSRWNPRAKPKKGSHGQVATTGTGRT